MLLFILIAVLLLSRRYGYGYGPYWNDPLYRGYGPSGAAFSGYFWNGFAWQPRYTVPYGQYPPPPSSYYQHPHWR